MKIAFRQSDFIGPSQSKASKGKRLPRSLLGAIVIAHPFFPHLFPLVFPCLASGLHRQQRSRRSRRRPSPPPLYSYTCTWPAFRSFRSEEKENESRVTPETFL